MLHIFEFSNFKFGQICIGMYPIDVLRSYVPYSPIGLHPKTMSLECAFELPMQLMYNYGRMEKELLGDLLTADDADDDSHGLILMSARQKKPSNFSKG